MPGMSGLELQKEIKKRWPKCRIIFLTGYDVFNYIHEAMKNEAVDYILKSENEDAIKDAVKKAIFMLAEKSRRERLEERVNENFVKMIPALKKDFFERLLNGEVTMKQELLEKVKTLQIELNPHRPVIVLMARIDDTKVNHTNEDETKIFAKLQSIIEDYFTDKILWVQIQQNIDVQIFLLQPIYLDENLSETDFTQLREHSNKVFQTLQIIQEECNKLFDFSVSFYMSNSFIDWFTLYKCCYEMEIFINFRFRRNSEMIVVGKSQIITEAFTESVDVVNTVHLALKKMNLLQQYLDTGHKEQFEEIYQEIMHSFMSCNELETKVLKSIKIPVSIGKTN